MSAGSSLIFNLVAAILGSVAVALVQDDTRPGIVAIVFVVFFAGAVIINRQEAITKMLRSPGKWRLPRRLKTVWTYEKDVGTVVVRDKLQLKHRGSYMWGHAESYRVEGPTEVQRYRYKLQGSLNSEGIVEGSWRSTLEGHNFYGFFQLAVFREVARDGTRAKGKWVGIDEGRSVGNGTWSWKSDGRD